MLPPRSNLQATNHRVGSEKSPIIIIIIIIIIGSSYRIAFQSRSATVQRCKTVQFSSFLLYCTVSVFQSHLTRPTKLAAHCLPVAGLQSNWSLNIFVQRHKITPTKLRNLSIFNSQHSSFLRCYCILFCIYLLNQYLHRSVLQLTAIRRP
jgi:hypothetical protein